MKFVIVLACLIAAAAAFHLESEWTQWKAKHGKSYGAEYEHIRRAIFNKNLRRIHQHNLKFKAGRVSYKLAANKFADLSPEEFDAHHKGLKAAARIESGLPFTYDASKPRAAEVDWRTKGVVTPVKDQADCGSCWAFSTTGGLEGQMAIKTGKLVSLAEQDLVDCDTYDMGCEGGLMDNAFTFIKQNGGIDTESSYPYTAEDGTCVQNKSNFAATDKGYVDIKAGSEADLQAAVHDIGPISIGFDAEENFQLYDGGVFTDDECETNSPDHGILVVGYGTTSDNQEYWIVKNSWGADWGEKGYIRVARNAGNVCGIASNASYPLI